MSYSNYEQTLVVNGYALSGVNNIDGSYGITEKPLRVAGVGFIDAIIDAPLEGNFTISRTMVGRDPLATVATNGRFDYDENPVSGAIFYGDNNFGFTNGRVTRYSVSCSVGQMPEIETDIRVFGQLGKDLLSSFNISINESRWYWTWLGDSVYLTNSDGQILDRRNGGENLLSSWNNKTLTLTEEEYNSLNTYTRIRGGMNGMLGLGKSAFNVVRGPMDAIEHEHPPIKFPDQSSISIKVSDFSVDAISDFSFTRTINLDPVYAIPKGTMDDWQENSLASKKNLEPVQIDTQYPIETDINFTMIANEYEVREIKDRIQSAPKSDIQIEIKDAKSDELINSFTGNNVRLIGESVNSSIDGEMSISLTYKGYDTMHNPVT